MDRGLLVASGGRSFAAYRMLLFCLFRSQVRGILLQVDSVYDIRAPSLQQHDGDFHPSEPK